MITDKRRPKLNWNEKIETTTTTTIAAIVAMQELQGHVQESLDYVATLSSLISWLLAWLLKGENMLLC